MLKTLRKNTKLVVWIVVISFTLWGAFSLGVSFKKKGRFAGQVFGKTITFQEYNRFYRMHEIFSSGNPAAEDPAILRQQTWMSIIHSREAKRRKIQVTDDEVRNEIKGIFKAQGITDLTASFYKQWLKRTLRLSPREFESQLREWIRIQKLVRETFNQAIPLATQEEAKERFLKDSRKIQFRKLKFASVEEAKAFTEKFKKSGSWEAAVITLPDLFVENLELSSMQDFIKNQPLDRAFADAIYNLEAGDISEPFSSENGYALYYAVSKSQAAESDFNAGKEKEYTDKLTFERRQKQFAEWNFKLLETSHLKDYTL